MISGIHSDLSDVELKTSEKTTYCDVAVLTSNKKFRLLSFSTLYSTPFNPHKPRIIHPFGPKMLSCLSDITLKPYAKFENKWFSGCQEKR